jgi:hypothetical protein
MSEEIKIVIFIKGNRGSIGIQSADCDPIFATFEGDLGTALERVPELVEEARQRWDSTPRYPICETKLEPPPQPVSQPQQTTQRAPQPLMERMF